MKNPIACALICVAFAFIWEFSTTYSNFGGNWTALFCTGSVFPPPHELAGEHIYIFANSTGYDGQFYHYVAHDPLYRGGIGRAIADPALRYRRILLPAFTWILAGGNQNWIDRSYIACNLLFLGFGTWSVARWLALHNAHPAFSLLYVLAPATLISLDRLVVDMAFTSLCLAFLLYRGRKADGKMYAAMALAALCRETGLVLIAAGAVEQWMARRYRRGFWLATAAIPAAAWSLYIGLHIPSALPVGVIDPIPLRGLWSVLWRPAHYNLAPAVQALATGLDYLEFIGIGLAAALAVRNVRRRGFGAIELACLLWALLACVLGRGFWEDCYSTARVLTPVLLFEALGWFTDDGWIALLPLLLVLPRIALQLAPQAIGIIRSVF